MDPHHQHCYICHAYFSDRVKLGIHISSCYNSHKDRRPDLPHPEEMLMDERRYTEYVKGAMQKNKEEMDLAQKRNVSYVSMGDFDDVRSQLKKPAGKPSSSASASPPQQGRYGGAPSSPTGSGAAAVRAKIPEHVSAGGKIVPTTGEDRTSALRPPSAQVVKQQTHTFQMAQGAQQPAPPQQQQPSSGYGITMLRNELTSELQKVKELREAEERRLTELNQPRPNSGHHNRYEPEAPFRPAKDGQQLPPLDPNAMQPQAQPHRRVVQFQSNNANQQSPNNNRPPSSRHHHTPVVGGSPSGGYPSAPPGSAHDERHTCPKCHREFGKKGYAVHVLRCGMHATEDFTYSRDRKYEHQHQQLLAEVQAPTSKITGQSEYGGEYHKQQQGGGGPQDDAQWTQFMTTYPRPVLDEKPKTQAERARAAQNAEMKKQMMQERPPSGAEEPRVPCERCGRYFAASRIRTHEGVCISKPGRFY